MDNLAPSTELPQHLKLEYGEISQFPEPDGFKEGAMKRLEEKRTNLYQQLASLSPSGTVYYPGSGADPIPFQIFGKRTIYGSLNETNYFQMLKDKDSTKPPAYKEQIEQTANLNQLLAIYADIRHSPFPDSTFKIIITHYLPLDIDIGIAQELSRLLGEQGIFVYDTYTDLKESNKSINNLLSLGFKPHAADQWSEPSNITYWGYSDLFSVKSGGQEMMTGLDRDEFLKGLQTGKEVKMQGHFLRVLEKRDESSTK